MNEQFIKEIKKIGHDARIQNGDRYNLDNQARPTHHPQGGWEDGLRKAVVS